MKPRRAFTVIELLVVIGIIALLGGLLVMAVGKMQASAKRRQTAQIMENCRSLFSEYDATRRPHYNTFDPMACPGNVTLELAPKDAAGKYIYSQLGRYGDAAIFTQAYMNQFRAMPVNAAAMAKMSPDSLTRMPIMLGAPSPWTAGSNYKAYNIANGRVYDPDLASRYLCVKSNAPSTAANEPPNPDYWLPEPTDTTIPLPLDAWGNPIIFVPWVLGLGGAWNGIGDPPAGRLGVNIVGRGSTAKGGRVFQAVAPDARPFFASAGPDGDFGYGDDNIYSFEK